MGEGATDEDLDIAALVFAEAFNDTPPAEVDRVAKAALELLNAFAKRYGLRVVESATPEAFTGASLAQEVCAPPTWEEVARVAWDAHNGGEPYFCGDEEGAELDTDILHEWCALAFAFVGGQRRAFAACTAEVKRANAVDMFIALRGRPADAPPLNEYEIAIARLERNTSRMSGEIDIHRAAYTRVLAERDSLDAQLQTARVRADLAQERADERDRVATASVVIVGEAARLRLAAEATLAAERAMVNMCIESFPVRLINAGNATLPGVVEVAVECIRDLNAILLAPVGVEAGAIREARDNAAKRAR